MCGMNNTTGHYDMVTITPPEPRKHPLELALSAALRREAVLREALEPFDKLYEFAKGYRHESGSTCIWRVEYDDLKAAHAALSACDEVTP